MPEYLTTVDQLHAAANGDNGPRYARAGRVAGFVLGLAAAVAGFTLGPVFVDYIIGVIDSAFVRVTG